MSAEADHGPYVDYARVTAMIEAALSPPFRRVRPVGDEQIVLSGDDGYIAIEAVNYVQPEDPVDEFQTGELPSTPFSFSYDGEVTDEITPPATEDDNQAVADDIDAKLEALPSIGVDGILSVTVWDSLPTLYSIDFAPGIDRPQMEIVGADDGTIHTDQQGGPGDPGVTFSILVPSEADGGFRAGQLIVVGIVPPSFAFQRIAIQNADGVALAGNVFDFGSLGDQVEFRYVGNNQWLLADLLLPS